MRLQKWISELGLGSRRQAEEWIREGKVFVNGSLVTELGTKVDPEKDTVRVTGKKTQTSSAPKIYWLLNKPDFCLVSRASKGSSENPDGDKATIFDLPKLRKVQFSFSAVGRLDYRTQGLLLLTNDGELSRRLCLPKYKVPRHYLALVNGKFTPAQLAEVKKGFSLKDGMVKDVDIKLAETKKIGATSGTWYFITVKEGRNRIVRRIVEHFDLKTVKLIRYGFGDLRLSENLKEGDYVQLSAKEIAYLKRITRDGIDYETRKPKK